MMKALTLWPEYAWLVAEGIKTTETRSWAPPGWLLGDRIAIHAAKRKPRLHELNAHILEALEERHPDGKVYMPYGVATRLPRGKIVATARLTSVGRVIDISYPYEKLEDDHVWLKQGYVTMPYPIDPYGDYSIGRWIWLLEDIRKLDKPIPARGMQRLWELPPDIAEAIA